MRVQAAFASLPLLDWRVIEQPDSRIRWVEAAAAGPEAFLKGFGRYGDRSFVRIPWRRAEIGYFNARRAIQLPGRLPGGNAAHRFLRRVYVGGPQVRFDLGALGTLRPERLATCRLRRAAAEWWSSPVRIMNNSVWEDAQLSSALPLLVSRFQSQSAVAGRSTQSEVQRLQAQVILIALIRKEQVPPSAVQVFDEPVVWYYRDPRVLGGDVQPDVNLILIEDMGDQLGLRGFSRVRRMRRELAWLHADLELLLALARTSTHSDSDVPESAWSLGRRVAEGLSRLDSDEAAGFEPLVFAAWATERMNQLSRLKPLLSTLAGKIEVPPSLMAPRNASSVDEKRRIYFQTVRHRLEHVRNDYPKHGLDLGEVPLVDTAALEGEHSNPATYSIDRDSALATYSCLPSSERVRLSIVIPFTGRDFPLIACLDGIARQTFVERCAEDVELIIVEDGPRDAYSPTLESPTVVTRLGALPKAVSIRRFVLRNRQGRAMARNVGIIKASGDVVMFLDSSMVVDEHHLFEHMMRHHRLPGLALLGFKENLTLPEYSMDAFETWRARSWRAPDPRGDWKWNHVISDEEVNGDSNKEGSDQNSYRSGDTVNYMRQTDYLHGISAMTRIGPRNLASFFQTNIVTTPSFTLRRVGGFHARAFRDNLWGMEDTHLGALLLTDGVRFVPCPTATAFKIEHAEPRNKGFELRRHKHLFEELLNERMWLRSHEAEDDVKMLDRTGTLAELT